jgi:capsule biosynthesis phosphatase
VIESNRVLVLDVDGTVCHLLTEGVTYSSVEPVASVVDRVRELHADGWRIVFYTARRMRSLEGNLGAITAKVVPELANWLDRNEIPYDEIHIGKPWAGHDGFYVDDRAIRPDEFVDLSLDEIRKLTGLA